GWSRAGAVRAPGSDAGAEGCVSCRSAAGRNTGDDRRSRRRRYSRSNAHTHPGGDHRMMTPLSFVMVQLGGGLGVPLALAAFGVGVLVLASIFVLFVTRYKRCPANKVMV